MITLAKGRGGESFDARGGPRTKGKILANANVMKTLPASRWEHTHA